MQPVPEADDEIDVEQLSDEFNDIMKRDRVILHKFDINKFKK